MEKEKTLLIMAAGLGSRFGGLKQLEPVGPNQEFIIDYSIYDAKRAGFNKVVFIIKKENYEVFKETIGKRIEPHIKTEYVFQEKNSFVPDEYQKFLEKREKPLGTAHAILCAKEKINGPFAVVNADDFYGKDAFTKASEILDTLTNERPYVYPMIGYLVKNTMTKNGAVKRGVCEVVDGKLNDIIECSIEEKKGKIMATPLNEEEFLEIGSFEVDSLETVSMNLFLLTETFFSYLEKAFLKFLEENKEDLQNREFFIPDVVFAAIEEDYATVPVFKTESTWYGITYREDLEEVKSAISKMTLDGIYPQDLWKD